MYYSLYAIVCITIEMRTNFKDRYIKRFLQTFSANDCKKNKNNLGKEIRPPCEPAWKTELKKYLNTGTPMAYSPIA